MCHGNTNNAIKMTELYLQDLYPEVVNRKLKNSLWKHKRQFDLFLFYFEKEEGYWKWTTMHVDEIQELKLLLLIIITIILFHGLTKCWSLGEEIPYLSWQSRKNMFDWRFLSKKL